MRTRISLAAVLLLAPAAVGAEDRKPYTPAAHFFTADLPSEGWHPVEEESATGIVVRVFGPEDPSGLMRATLSVRLLDRDSPSFLPIKQAVDAMRAPDSATSREATPVRPLRIPAGLARIFEIIETRRLPVDEGPSFPVELHHYVAVIPQGGESYFVVRLVTARQSYLDFRDDFVRFLKSFRPLGGAGR